MKKEVESFLRQNVEVQTGESNMRSTIFRKSAFLLSKNNLKRERAASGTVSVGFRKDLQKSHY